VGQTLHARRGRPDRGRGTSTTSWTRGRDVLRNQDIRVLFTTPPLLEGDL
jgi:hypothetical protein